MNKAHGIAKDVVAHGWPHVKFPIEQWVLDNFWAKVDKSPHPKGCWVWTASVNIKGYGQTAYRQRMCGAHRMSYVIHNGLIPEGMLICHHCDNRVCVNPTHLFIGTAQDNSTDMKEKGRSALGPKNGMIKNPHKQPRGEVHGNSKFTAGDILEIRRLYASKWGSATQIGLLFGTSKKYVLKVVHRQTWTHI